jgi:formylglycine-generating enzyme required for sulfatase activity
MLGYGSFWTSQSGNIKLLRGGSWYSDPDHCRSAFRDHDTLDGNDHVGFRVVCSGAART